MPWLLRVASLVLVVVVMRAAVAMAEPADMQLRAGTPEQVGLNPGPVHLALAAMRGFTGDQIGTGHPLYSGEVSLLVHRGVVVAEDAAGYALRYSDRRGDPLPANEQIPVRTDTIFDLASLSKLFTSMVAMQQVDAGRLDLAAPVGDYLPEFAEGEKAAITVQELLTHTSGLPADLPLWRWPDVPARIAAIRDVVPVGPAGVTYLYSDVNMLVLEQVLRAVTGTTLDQLVREGITQPLGLDDTMYNPPEDLRERIAATEYAFDVPDEPDRGLMWGEVHDESAWALGGVAGNAGLFGTARDVAVMAQTLLNGGTYGDTRILSEASARRMLTDNTDPGAGHPHGLGFDLNQPSFMGWMASPQTAGHTGFTGTSLVIDPRSDTIVILFTNRVHPTRDWPPPDVARSMLADGMTAALASAPG